MNKKKLISSLMAFVMTFSLLFNFGGNGYLKAFAKDGENTILVEQKEDSKNTTPSAIEVDENKENKKTASIEPTSIEINPGDEFTFNVKNTGGNILYYSSDIPGGIGFDNSFVFIKDGKVTIKLQNDEKPGEYKLSSVGIYKSQESPMRIMANGVDDKDKVASLPDITIKVKGQTKGVESIVLNKNQLNLNVNDSETLIATISPEEVLNKGIIWTSNCPDIVEVDQNGKVTGIKAGEVTITATTEDGSKSTTCRVEVKDKGYYKKIVSDAIEAAAPKVVDFHCYEEWAVVGLAGAGRQDLIYKDYFENKSKFLNDPKQAANFLKKPTEYERVTLGVLSAGGNPKNIGGVNMINRICNAHLEGQGINALVFGLIALDAGHYKEPEGATWTREKLIKAILKLECTNKKNNYAKLAGWAFGGDNADPDMTGMAVTALAPYYNDEHKDVQEAVDRAVEWMSWVQKDDGGYASWGTKNSESCDQIIMGLCAVGIDPTEPRFTKKGKNVIDALLTFKCEDGSFAHITEGMGAGPNGMATEQALYSLDQFMYYLDGKGRLYDFGDKNSDEDAPNVLATGIKLEDTEISMEENTERTLKAILLPQNASNENVTWTSDNEEVATIERQEAKGGIKLKAKAQGDATITATADDGSQVKASFKLHVIKLVHVNGVQLEPNKLALKTGEQSQLKVIITPDNATNKKVRWSTSNDAIVTVDENGKLEAWKEGEVEIYIQTEDSYKSSICTVTVTGEPIEVINVTEITLDKKNLELREGQAGQLIATVLPEKAKNKRVSWSSSDDDIVTVEKNGKIIGVKAGEVTITAITSDGAKTAICTVKVSKEAIKVNEIKLDKDKLEIKEGQEGQLIAKVLPDTATNKKVTWISSDANIAKVDETGKVTGVKAGEATITAITEDGKKTVSCTIKVVKFIEKMLDIENLTGQTQYKKNGEAKIIVRAKNIVNKEQRATLIVALYNSEGEFVNYVAAKQDIKAGESTELTGRIKLPDADGYTIRAFVWDSLDDMNILSDTIEIPVK